VKPATTQTVSDANRRRGASVRTALTLASIALVFFGGIIYAQYSGEPAVGMSVLGFAIFGFLLVTIGRNLRK
jgi:membrane associated rhomboid family serine protease